MSENNSVNPSQFQGHLQENSGLITFTGILLLVIGLLAMGSPLVAGLSFAIMLGIMLIINGISQLYFAFKSGKGLSAFVFGALTLIIGIFVASRPGAALASLTLFLAMYLIISGGFEVSMSFQFKPAKGWGWIAFSGVISILLGIMIWNQFPLSGVWAVGILIGVRFFFSGVGLLALGLAARQPPVSPA